MQAQPVFRCVSALTSAILPTYQAHWRPTVWALCCQKYSSLPNRVVDMDNIYSLANKERCVSEMQSVEPIRTFIMGRKMPEKTAAVLIPLCHCNGIPSILYTLRSSNLASHRGEVSFPGGMTDEDDVDAAGTALRETQEEVGLSPQGIQLWGKLHPVPSRNFASAVTPVVGYCGEINPQGLVLNEEEVEDAFVCSVESLCDPNNIHYTRWKRGYALPVFTAGQYRIWGMTAIMTHLLLNIIAPNLYCLTFPYHIHPPKEVLRT